MSLIDGKWEYFARTLLFRNNSIKIVYPLKVLEHKRLH